MKVRTRIAKGMGPAMGKRKTVVIMTTCGHRRVVMLLKTLLQDTLFEFTIVQCVGRPGRTWKDNIYLLTCIITYLLITYFTYSLTRGPR
jgi:hypothetical protein